MSVNAPLSSVFQPLAGPRDRSWPLALQPSLSLLLIVLVAITALRIAGLAVSNAELFYDEAQYWAWAQQPDFGYYTKPPLIAWVIGATTAVCGDTPFCVRLPSPLLHLAISLVIYALGTKLHSRQVGFWAALIYAAMPGTSVSATLMSTDVPLLLFWSLALLALAYHVERPSWALGLALGAAIGLGLNAKYAMGFFIPCYAAYAIVSAKARASLRHPATWAALVVALLIITPNLLWNAQHQFATFEHTRENADWSGRFPNLLGLLAFIGTQAAIIGPVPFAAFVLAAIGRRTGVDVEPLKFHLATSLPVFALISAQALISKANGNWAATGFPAAVVLATAVMLALQWRRGMIVTMAISAVALVSVSFAGVFAGTVTTGPVGRELGKMVGWGDFAGQVRQLADKNGLKTVVFMGRGLTASMIYELRGTDLDIRAYAGDPNAPGDHFEMTRPWAPADKGPVLLVFAGDYDAPAAVTGRATLVERFKTDIFVTRSSDWIASAYRID